MYLSPDDAKTDVILAAAVAVLGVSLRGFVVSLPLYPGPGLVAAILDLVWLIALSALVPVLLARYRQDGASAFGFTGAGHGWRHGLLLAVPVVLLGIAVQALATGVDGVGPLLGRLAAPLASGSVLELGFVLAAIAVLAVGAQLLFGFLAVRSREGFPRSPTLPLTQLVRTVGIGAVAVAAVGGLLRALIGGSLVIAAVNTLAVAAVLVLTDRRIPAELTVPRTTVVAPVVVVVAGSIFATGGLFRGNLLTGLTLAALATAITVAIASLAQTRDGAAATVPLVVSAHLWPTCLSPLVMLGGAQPFANVC